MEYFVAEMRIKRNMTIRGLAAKSGVTKSYIQKIEAGETNPSLLVMCKLAVALECKITDLYKYEP